MAGSTISTYMWGISSLFVSVGEDLFGGWGPKKTAASVPAKRGEENRNSQSRDTEEAIIISCRQILCKQKGEAARPGLRGLGKKTTPPVLKTVSSRSGQQAAPAIKRQSVMVQNDGMHGRRRNGR